MLTKEQIINETVEYYRTHSRSIVLNSHNNVVCKYNGDNGAKCAFSRCCRDGNYWLEGKGVRYHLDRPKDYINILKPEYLGHPTVFWESIQMLHNTNENWKSNNEGGNDLTAEGESKRKILISIYA